MSLLNEAPAWPADGAELPQQFEYFTVSAIGPNPLANITGQLDTYGRAGWEMCGVAGFTLIFKRPYFEVTKPPVRHAERVAVDA